MGEASSPQQGDERSTTAKLMRERVNALDLEVAHVNR